MLSLVCAAVFVISQMHGSNFLTRMIKIVITVLPIPFVVLLELWNPHPSPGAFVCVLIGCYYIGLIIIMVVLMLIKYMIGTIVKKKNDFYLHKKK